MNAPAGLKTVLKDVAKAKGLPNAHYIDPAVFEEERHHVLYANWAGIGFGKDIPEIGDAKPVDFLGMPLLLVRDEDGAINVYQNTCRHRGMILVEEPQKIRGAIRCPYHSWCYTLKGALRTTPHVGGPGTNIHDDIKRDELGLLRVRAHVWQDVVFVNIDGQAAPFEEANAGLLERWKEFEKPTFHGGAAASFKLDVKTNWKLAVENYCESYHLPWVHPGLNSYSRLEDHYHIEERGFYSGQGTLVYRQLTSEGGAVFPDFEGLSDKWDTGAEYISVYPNVLMGVHRDHTYAIILEPVALAETVEHIEIYYAEPPEHLPDGLVEANSKQWKEVFVEDVFVVEGMQKGRQGILFDGGKFSPAMDGPTHNFHHWVATNIEAGRAKSA
ncbi:aromatic ring-hydroxylating dioxygenase subunit alpha [Rhodobacteraceae bacterium]|nr:aromatic ring-hydroxylating dioxygenase subunit alpha [Paracoccaceae bacterium]